MAEESVYKTAGGGMFGKFVSVSRFVVTEGAKNELLLRCFNGGDRIVTGLTIAVHLLRDDGTEIKCREFTVSGLFGEPGTEFALREISLPASWHKVRAEILTAQTFDREYDFRNGTVSYIGAPVRRRVRVRDKTSSPLVKYGAILSALLVLLVSVSVLTSWLKAEKTEEAAQTAYVENLGADEEIC